MSDFDHLPASAKHRRRGRYWAEVLAQLALAEGEVDVSRLQHSRALWNRSLLDLRSDEILTQILDRGDMETGACCTDWCGETQSCAAEFAAGS